MLYAFLVGRTNRLVGVAVASKRILVVDDDAVIRAAVTLCLEQLGGWAVLTAASAREARQPVETELLDAIVLDVRMPEMDGLTFLDQLRADPTMPIIPVVLLTANRDLPDPELLSALGIVVVIRKPFQALELVRQIAQALDW